MNEIARIAAWLSKAQREYLTTRAEWRAPTAYVPPRWMTFPPANTHRVLMQHGLVDRSGQILTKGLRVRAHIMGEVE